MVPTKRSAIALARGARTGVLMILTSRAANTASNAAVYLASRSRMRNRKRLPASSRSMSRLRACWVSHAAVGDDAAARPDGSWQAKGDLGDSV